MFLFIKFFVFDLYLIFNQRYYYKIYSIKQRVSIKKIFFVYLCQTILLSLCFIFGIYNSALTSFVMYIANSLPLFIYRDTWKNKLLIYFVVFACLTVSELVVSIFYVIISTVMDISIVFPQDQAIAESFLYFVQFIPLFMINYLISGHLPYFLDQITILDMRKSIFLIGLTAFFMLFNMNCLYSTPIDIFGYVTVAYVFIFVLTLYIFYMNLKEIFNRYIENIEHKNQKIMFEKQRDSLKDIDNNFKNIRKRNHDFENHMIVINNLINQNDVEVIQYLENLLHKNT